MKPYILKYYNEFFGDWGLGIGPNPQSPIPNPQTYISQIMLIA